MPLTLAGSGTITGLSATQQGLGLTLITAQSFTAASSVSIDNCFSATYDNYRVVADMTGSGTGQQLFFRLRVSGADNSASQYSQRGTSSNTAGTVGAYNLSASSNLELSHITTGDKTTAILDFIDPFVVDRTRLHWTALANTSGLQAVSVAGDHSASTSFTGFTIYPASGTITGTIRVYGYTN